MRKLEITWIHLAVMAVFLMSCGSREESERPATSGTPDATTSTRSPEVDGTSGKDAARGPRSRADISTLRRMEPSATVDVEIGNHFFSRGELDSAVVYYRSATDREPGSAANWNFLGICLARLGRIAEAEDAYQKAEAADPYYPSTYVNRGNIFFSKGEYENAIVAYNVATSIDSTEANVWLNLGMTYKKVDKINKAILAYNKAIECAPDDPRPWEKLGYLYYERKLYSTARERWLEAVERDSTREDLKANIQSLMDYAESTGTR